VGGDGNLVDQCMVYFIRRVFETVTSVQKRTTGFVMLVQSIQVLEDIPSLVSRIPR
jgi:hypothetical protein